MPIRRSRSIFLGSILLFGLGCHPPTPTEEHSIAPVDTTKPQIAFTRATIRGAFLVPAEQKLRVCAEPMPDAALDQTLAVLFELAHKGKFTFGNKKKLAIAIESDNSAKSSRTLTLKANELGGRNPTVLIARELLYRLCELTINVDPATKGYEEASKNYAEVAKAIVTMAEADASRAGAAKADAEAKKTDAQANEAYAQARKTIADAELLKVKMAAQAQISGVDAHVSLILAQVTRSGATCTIDKERLKAALAASEFEGVRGVLAGETSCEALRETLRALAPSVLGSLAAAALATVAPAPAITKK